MSLSQTSSTLFNHLSIWTLLTHTTHSIPIQNLLAMNISINITSNLTLNYSFITSELSTTPYKSTGFITTFTDSYVGISKELLYISAAIFLIIIILLLTYCIYRCMKHRKKLKQSKKPVNNIDDIDEDTKKINAFEVTLTQNEFALHKTQNAYAINPLNRVASSSATSAVELNKMNSTSTNTVNTVGSLMNINNAMNSNCIPTSNSQKPVTILPQIKTEITPNNNTDNRPPNTIVEFVASTPLGVGDQRNRTGTIEYTSQPSQQKKQAMLEPIDTPFFEENENENEDEHMRNMTTDSNQTMKYVADNGMDENEEEQSTDSEIDSDDVSHSDTAHKPIPVQMPPPEQIEVVDTLTAMIQKAKNSNVTQQQQQQQQQQENGYGNEESEEESEISEYYGTDNSIGL